MKFVPIRRVQQFDALTCAGAGVLCTAAAAPLAELTGLPRGLLLGAGAFLPPFSGLVLWSASRQQAGLVRALAAVNVLWVLASAGLLLSGAFPVTLLGQAFVGLQAAAVAVIAALQFAGLRGVPERRAAA